MLYPQNGDRMVTVDSMTSVHAGCLRDSSWRAYILHDCYNRRAARRGIELRRRRLTQRDSRDADGPRARRPRHQLRADKLNCYMCSAASPPARLARCTCCTHRRARSCAPLLQTRRTKFVYRRPSYDWDRKHCFRVVRPFVRACERMYAGTCPSVGIHRQACSGGSRLGHAPPNRDYPPPKKKNLPYS